MELKEIKGREILVALEPTIVNEDLVAEMTTEEVYAALHEGYDLEWGKTSLGEYEWMM